MTDSRAGWLAVVLAVGAAGCGPGGRTDPPAAGPKAGSKAGDTRPDDQAPPPRPVPDSGKVYALLVGDTTAAAAVAGFTLEVEKNLAAVRRALAGGVGAGRLHVTVLTDKDATPAAVEAAIGNLPVTPDDTLVCYVAGHASYTLSDPDGHTFFLHGAPKSEIKMLPRPTLRGWLTGKKPRLAVLLSDTSMGILAQVPGPAKTQGTAGVDGVAPELPAADFPPPADPAAVLPGFRQLFLRSAGVVDLNGSDDGTNAWSPTGESGFFARSLLRVLADARSDPAAAWPDVYRRVKDATERGYRAWRDAELKRLKSAATLPPADQRTLTGLTALTLLTPRAYYLPGLSLRVITRSTDGKGMRVAELPLDSPLRAKGVKRGEVIVKAQGQDTLTPEQWQKTAADRAAAGETKFTFRVRAADGAERDVAVELPR